MGMDIKGPEPDPRHWASCSCGEYKVYGESTEEVRDKVLDHFLNNLKTHTRGISTNGSYMLYVPPKPNWWKRTFGKHIGKDNG